MPPKAKITKEEILSKAVALVREEGVGALTAKSLAAKLGCSTQPIFWHYSGMDEIRSQVCEQALRLFDRFIRSGGENVSPYKAIGLNYIRFAEEEKELFKLLFMSENERGNILSEHAEIPYILNVLKETENIGGDAARAVYEEMWLFSHGIATMIATGTARFSREKIDKMLSDVYRGLVKNLGSEHIL